MTMPSEQRGRRGGELVLQALAASERSLRQFAAAPPRHANPLGLSLPALPPTSEQFLTEATVGALAALYLYAELEQAGLLPITEALASARRGLHWPSVELAERLERFADSARDNDSRALRDDLFARVFGLGGGARVSTGSGTNIGFVQALARFASAIVVYREDLGGAAADARLRMSGIALANTLALHRGSHIVLAARRLQSRIRQALAIWSDRALLSAIGARHPWQAIEQVAGPLAPDVRVCTQRGSSGQVLITWLGSVLMDLRDPNRTLAPPERVVLAAVRWLGTYGVAGRLRPNREQRAAT